LEDLPKIEEFNQLGVEVPKAENLQIEATVAQVAVEEGQEPVIEQAQEEVMSQESSGQSRSMKADI